MSVTPMMYQYNRIKKDYKDAILFFRMGDFYEMFEEDAKIASKELDLVLTSRDRGKGKKVPMAGVPHHSAGNYISRLIKKGYKVAICEQVEDPRTAKGLVKREVIKVITPGTIIEEEMLGRENNYLMALVHENGAFGIAFADISTGDFFATELDGDDARLKLFTEISRFRPAELILPKRLEEDKKLADEIREQGVLLSPLEDEIFGQEVAEEQLKEHFKVVSLDGFGLNTLPLAMRASGAIIEYLKETQKNSLRYIETLNVYSISETMILDSTTLRNLEIERNIRDGGAKNTLLDVLDKTVTPMGSRLIRKWLKNPLKDVVEILKRQNAVEEICNDIFLRKELRDELKDIRDIERLNSKVVYGNANAKDLVLLRDSLSVTSRIKGILQNRTLRSELLSELSSGLDEVIEVVELIERAIVDEPPATLSEGGVIKSGYSEQLDMLRRASREGKQWISGLEEKERRRTGIKSLKVGYNKVFGYYIEVTKAHLRLVPEHYIRKQTLVNAERFVTQELKEKESLVLSADEKSIALEQQIFSELREKIATFSKRIQSTAKAIAQLDVLCSLSDVAVVNNYTKPEINESDTIIIKDGRHPVVEQMLSDAFIPNDAKLDCKDNQLIIITGPNMAGKSTYMRQIALITIMAQIGSFVPASYASIGIVDRIFTRVGAFDDLTRGQSTFMVEMIELANILNSATSRSLILLDEIGRGTSTYDGLSIAWSVAEYIHNKRKIGAKTLFATHYHNLTELGEILEGVTNYHIAIKEDESGIIFLRKVMPGATNRSYGIDVAKLAGLPKEVIERAREVLSALEEENIIEVEGKKPRKSRKEIPRKTARFTQLVLFEPTPQTDPVIEEIKSIDINTITPLEALEKLYELQSKVKGEEDKRN